jgi:hypothetical protein
MEPSPDNPEPETLTLTQPPPCLNPKEREGGPTSSPAAYHYPPELDEHESEERKREGLSSDGEEGAAARGCGCGSNRASTMTCIFNKASEFLSTPQAWGSLRGP